MNRIGEKAYILGNGYGKKPHPPVPYIYSKEEIAALWSVADSMAPTRQAPLRYLVVPAIFRVMYCCGLRPDEARKLKTKNVDLDSGRIAIQESKKHADRIVMMSDDLLEYCRHYDRKMQIRIPNRTFFFSKPDGGAYTPSWFFQIFLALRIDAGITSSAHSTPRLYDFRHSFATHRLYSWMGEGKDLAAMLPYLSAYMGHARLSDTYYYIHLVPEQLKTVSGLDFKKYESLLPGVEAYD